VATDIKRGRRRRRFAGDGMTDTHTIRAPTPVSRQGAATSKKAREGFNPALNGYRGLCATLVFVYHLGAAGVIALPHGDAVSDSFTFLWSSLAYGVEMFFMISGFVILGSLLRHASVAEFLKDRFIRIFSAWVPALLAVTVVCSALNMKMLADLSLLERLGIFAANLLLLPPLVPLPLIHFGSWSLTYEWVFYFSAATGALLLRNPVPRRWMVAVWLLAAAGFVCLFPRALFFLTGVLVFTQRAWFLSHARWLRFPLLSLLLFLIAWKFTEVNRAQLSDTLFDWARDGRWVAACIAFVASLHMFACACLNARGVFSILNTRLFQFLGNISYSFYLWHGLVMAAVKRVVSSHVIPAHGTAVGFVVFAAACASISIPLAWASWKVFELALAKFARRRLASRLVLEEVARAT
jgi:peptidoglycan/LPS O-acetylase OafA/YrhL